LKTNELVCVTTISQVVNNSITANGVQKMIRSTSSTTVLFLYAVQSGNHQYNGQVILQK